MTNLSSLPSNVNPIFYVSYFLGGFFCRRVIVKVSMKVQIIAEALSRMSIWNV